MKAVVLDRYGPPEVLRLEEVEWPAPKADEVLVRVHATSVNRTDSGFRSPDTFVTRLFSGLFRPKRRILGNEMAGEIEAVGAAVKDTSRRLKPKAHQHHAGQDHRETEELDSRVAQRRAG